MMEDLRARNNIHALSRMLKQPVMPTATLGVGEDEILQTMNMKVEYEKGKNYTVIPDIHTLPSQMNYPAGTYQPLNEKELPSEFYVGDTIGRV